MILCKSKMKDEMYEIQKAEEIIRNDEKDELWRKR
jgi:hypothetical protein